MERRGDAPQNPNERATHRQRVFLQAYIPADLHSPDSTPSPLHSTYHFLPFFWPRLPSCRWGKMNHCTMYHVWIQPQEERKKKRRKKNYFYTRLGCVVHKAYILCSTLKNRYIGTHARSGAVSSSMIFLTRKSTRQLLIIDARSPIVWCR